VHIKNTSKCPSKKGGGGETAAVWRIAQLMRALNTYSNHRMQPAQPLAWSGLRTIIIIKRGVSCKTRKRNNSDKVVSG
jgi:hypothetical protein